MDLIGPFSERFGKWLVTQPEWPVLLGMPRSYRRKFAQEIARKLTTIPTRGGE